MTVRWRWVVVAGLALACRATTGRPPFTPFPEAAHGEIGFGQYDPAATVAQATRAVAEALAADSLPVSMAREADGYVETPWFLADSLTPTRRPALGPDVVRVRAWITPAKPGFGLVEVETVFRPVADPSLPDRELEHHVADDHPVSRRVVRLVQALVERFGEPADSAAPRRQVTPTAAQPPVAPQPTPPARPDTTGS